MKKHLTPIFVCLFKMGLIFLIAILVTVTSFGLCKVAFGNSAILAWDANSESNLAGYNIYYNTVSPDNPYTGEGIHQGVSPITVELQHLSTPQNPSFQLTGLAPGQTYFFKLTAYNSSGVESHFSNGVSCDVPEPAAMMHKVTASKAGNGMMNPSGEVEVVDGTNQSYTISAGAGYLITDVKVDGVSVGPLNTYTFQNISEEHAIEAIFTKEHEELPEGDSLSEDGNNDMSPGNNVYVMDAFDLHIIDVSDQKNPVERGYVDVGYANGLAISGNYVYMATDFCFQIADVSDAKNPVITSILDMPDWTTSVAVAGDYAYIGGFFGLQIIDIQKPGRPAIVGSLEMSVVYHITVLNNYAFITNDAGLQVVDVSNPYRPVVISSVDGIWVNYTTISNNYAYLAVGYRLEIVDITDPYHPVFMGFADADWANEVEVKGDYAYLADDNGLQIIDISNSNNPVTVSSVDTQDFAHSVALSGNYAYVAVGYNGLLVINIADPNNPAVSASVDSLGDVRFVKAPDKG